VVVARRGFLVVSGGALAAGVLAACGSSNDEESGIATETGTEQSTSAEADVAILNQALGLEQRIVAAYQTASTRLHGTLRRTAEQFGGQEREHAEALSQAVTQLGASPQGAQDRYALPSLPDEVAVLRFVLGVEDTLAAQYLDLIPKLSSPNLRATFASILTVEGEHVAVLREKLGQDAIPDAFVRGRA
jgi:rubrerythrin